MSNHPIVGRFPFTRDGHANRRDADAHPRISVVAIDCEDHELHYHRAGDEYIRSVPLIELKGCDELIEGMSPQDAFLVGVWASESTRQYREPVQGELGAEA